MKSSTLLKTLRDHSGSHIRFLLPDGGLIPLHAHVTEVGRVDKTFLDCGGTTRRTSSLCLQTWVADDVDHRLPAGKLADIIDRAAPILGNDDLEVEVEYEEGFISQFPIESATQRGDTILFTLGTKHTDCLAKEICLPNPQESSSCCSGTGCC
jgi:hypothetical protein